MAEIQAATDGAERRVAPRMRALKRARVVFNNRFSTVDCIVRNISRTGALLTVDTSVPLPKQFEISIDDSELRPARQVYRRETFVGVHFLDVGAEEDLPNVANGREADRDGPILPQEGAPGIARIEHLPLPVALRAQFPWIDAG